MAAIKTEIGTHPTELEIADFLSNSLSGKEKERTEEHLAVCGECLEKVAAAYESVRTFKEAAPLKKGKAHFMKAMNIYLVLALLSFILSFAVPRHFIQFLVATLLFGIKWIVDSKSTKMLIMIYEAWKKGGEKEASRILERFDSESKDRL